MIKLYNMRLIHTYMILFEHEPLTISVLLLIFFYEGFQMLTISYNQHTIYDVFTYIILILVII